MTNGSLFYDPDVRRACLHADLILPTLDAGDEETFQVINRPAAGLTLARVAEGLEALRREYSGQIWLEVFLVEGVNSSPEQVRKIGAIAERIRPDRIQLQHRRPAHRRAGRKGALGAGLGGTGETARPEGGGDRGFPPAARKRPRSSRAARRCST